MGTPTAGCMCLVGILFTPKIWGDRAKLKGGCWGTGGTPWNQWVTQGVLPAEVGAGGANILTPFSSTGKNLYTNEYVAIKLVSMGLSPQQQRLSPCGGPS